MSRRSAALPNPMTRREVSDQVGMVSAVLGQHYVSYHPILAKVTGNVKSALMLSHAIAWSRHIHMSEPAREGWFWMTARDWREGTGLSVREQATARAILERMNILQEKLIGMPAKLWYRIDLDCLGSLVARELGQEFQLWRWDRQGMIRLLGQPIPCHRALIRLADSVVGGLLLSYLFQSTRRCLVNGENGDWIHVPVEHTRDFLGITAKQQRLARARLRDDGLITEMYESIAQPRLLTQLRLQVIAQKCTEISNEIHCLQDSRKHVSEILQTRVALSAKQGWPEAQNKGGPNREARDAQNANQDSPKGQVSIKKENIQKPQLHIPLVSEAPVGSGSEMEIALPAGLLADETKYVNGLLFTIPSHELRQLVADEWAGLLDLAKRGVRPVHNRLGLLHRLVQAANGVGQPFVPTLAFEVAERRRRRVAIQENNRRSAESYQHQSTASLTDNRQLREALKDLWPTWRPKVGA